MDDPRVQALTDEYFQTARDGDTAKERLDRAKDAFNAARRELRAAEREYKPHQERLHDAYERVAAATDDARGAFRASIARRYPEGSTGQTIS